MAELFKNSASVTSLEPEKPPAEKARVNLTAEQQAEITAHVEGIAWRWAKFLGVINVSALVVGLAYVWFVLPTMAFEQAFDAISAQNANAAKRLSDEYSELLLGAGALREKRAVIRRLTDSLERLVTQSSGDLRAIDAEAISRVLQLARQVTDTATVLALAERVESMTAALSPREGPDSIIAQINNRHMAGPDEMRCGPGYFVAGIHASRGVGGRYAVDGISELTVTCARVWRAPSR